jgi:pyruvate/2-oxoglutarate dehydrogenase complex dihydrolipoamide dehydrogenase (E3) component
MPPTEAYDTLVLGSGEAGKYIAWHLASAGQRVAVIERRYIGGSCPNIACLPSKNVIHSARVASYFRRSEEFGISKDGWRIDMVGVRERKRKMVDGLVQMNLSRYEQTGTELIIGRGRFVAPKTLEVTRDDGVVTTLRGDRVVLSTGSRATVEDVPGLRACSPLTHVEALELDTVPAHLLVLGGGYVGLEFAQAMRRFGSQVTIIERDASLAHHEDADVIEALHELCREEGIEVCTQAALARVDGRSGDAVEAHIVQRGGSEVIIKGTHLLVASGRTPNTDGIGLDVAGVATTGSGHVKVNERLETTAPDVWAVGDCAGSPHFTHIAFDDYRVVRDNMAGQSHVTTGRQVPFTLFTDPELARVGLSEKEAGARGIDYRVAKLPMKMVLRTRTLSEERGFMKALIAVDSDRVLGFTAFGVEAGELLPAVQIVMSAGLPYTVLRDAVITHPTMSEGLGPLLSKIAAPAVN